jgi:hypothetical protein
MRLSAFALSACALALTLLAGCGDDEPSARPEPTSSESSTPSATPTETPTPSPTEDPGLVIDATIRDNDIEPNGKRFQAKVGEEITINIDADRAGELHVHSVPEQTLAYDAGKSTLKLTIDTPGVVDVEDHGADKVLVSLQVS